ncbi:MAG: hypothetical protein AABX08_03045 [Nanoarchaeota archaeon]
MVNIIQDFFLLIPNFKVEYFALLPAVALFFVGLFVETNYTSKLTFFMNSVTLLSYFGLKPDIKPLTGLLTLAFFILTTWSFICYVRKVDGIRWYENLINNNRWILKLGGSLVVGLILFLDQLSL